MAAPTAQELVLRKVLEEFQKISIQLATLSAELQAFKSTLDPVVKLIRGEGDIPSIPTQIALLGQDLNNIKTDVTEIKSSIDDIEDKLTDAKNEVFKVQEKQKNTKETSRSSKNKTLIVVAVIGAVSGIGGAIIGALLK